MTQPRRPHLVFVFSDQQHWRAAGYRDGFFRTPVQDALARESVVFEHAFCSTPQCSPSRSSILTGLYPSRTGVMGNVGAAGGPPLQLATVGRALQSAGYRTAYFGKWHLGKDPVGTAGWDEDLGVTGPETLDDQAAGDRAADFIRRGVAGEQPLALFVSINDPHDVYSFRRWDGDVPPDTPLSKSLTPDALHDVPGVQRQFMAEDQGRVMRDATPDLWRRYRACYRDKVAAFDAHLGRVVESLRQHDLLDDTLLIVTSDHGDMDTHHGLIWKGPFMYEQMVRVPLLVRLPRAWGGPVHRIERDAHTVNVDWFPTLLDAASEPAPETGGISLVPVLRGGSAPLRRFVISEYYGKQDWVNPMRMIRTDTAKLVRHAGGDRELYDLAMDPDETRNLILDPSRRWLRDELAAGLDQWIAQRGDPFPMLVPTTRDGAPLTPESPA